jgi:hypothetical protein
MIVRVDPTSALARHEWDLVSSTVREVDRPGFDAQRWLAGPLCAYVVEEVEPDGQLQRSRVIAPADGSLRPGMPVVAHGFAIAILVAHLPARPDHPDGGLQIAERLLAERAGPGVQPPASGGFGRRAR